MKYKFRKLLSLLLRYPKSVRGETYYPECKRKSTFVVLRDQLYFFWKYGDVEPFYYTYGFDRVGFTRKKMCDEYIIPYAHFMKKVNYLNFNNPRYDSFHGKLTGRVITGDKFYFNIFLERFGIPTPKVYCFIKDKKPLYFHPDYNIDPAMSPESQLKSFLSKDMDAFAKPSDGQLGNGVFSLKIENGRIFMDGKESSIGQLMEVLLSADYLIQERIVQHPKISALCSTTLNSIRLQTVMDLEGNVIPFGAGLRMGREGSYVDNWAKGGIFVGIDPETGKMRDRGFLKPVYGTSAFAHLDSKVVFKDYEIPFFHEAVQLAVKLHSYLYRCHSVGWDIAITEKGPVFIEANGLWEISLIQAANGGMKHVEKFFDCAALDAD